jgi:hypothetical protein
MHQPLHETAQLRISVFAQFLVGSKQCVGVNSCISRSRQYTSLPVSQESHVSLLTLNAGHHPTVIGHANVTGKHSQPPILKQHHIHTLTSDPPPPNSMSLLKDLRFAYCCSAGDTSAGAGADAPLPPLAPTALLLNGDTYLSASAAGAGAGAEYLDGSDDSYAAANRELQRRTHNNTSNHVMNTRQYEAVNVRMHTHTHTPTCWQVWSLRWQVRGRGRHRLPAGAQFPRPLLSFPASVAPLPPRQRTQTQAWQPRDLWWRPASSGNAQQHPFKKMVRGYNGCKTQHSQRNVPQRELLTSAFSRPGRQTTA